MIRSIRIPASILSAVFQRYLFDLFSTCRRDVCRYNRYIPVGNRNRSFPPSPRVSSSSSPPRRSFASARKKRSGKGRISFLSQRKWKRKTRGGDWTIAPKLFAGSSPREESSLTRSNLKFTRSFLYRSADVSASASTFPIPITSPPRPGIFYFLRASLI